MQPLSIYDLYDLCVQSPADLVPLLRAIHGGEASVLMEHFAASARISRRWVELDDRHKAVAVDHDAEVLGLSRGIDRLTPVVADVLDAGAVEAWSGRCDIVHAGNFSIGYHHERATLMRYLRQVRDLLAEGGVFVCDTYGGESAYHIGSMQRDCPIPAGFEPSHGPGGSFPADAFVRYTWEQRSGDPVTGRVLNALHFRVFVGDEIVQEETDAFVYDWRLWSLPELRDAFLDAGFAGVECYNELPDAVDEDGLAYAEPVEGEDLNDSFIVCLAARTG